MGIAVFLCNQAEKESFVLLQFAQAIFYFLKTLTIHFNLTFTH